MAGFPRSDLGKEGVLLQRILSREVSGGPRDWVVMNAAMLLYAAGKAPSISAAIPLATHAVESGAAARKLEELAVSPVADTSGGGSHVAQPMSQGGVPPPSDVSHAEALAS